MVLYRHHILVCTADGSGHCGEKGGLALLQAVRAEVARLGTADVLVTKAGCSHQHACGPAVIAYPQGVWYREVTPADVPELVAAVRAGTVVERLRNPAIAVHS